MLFSQKSQTAPFNDLEGYKLHISSFLFNIWFSMFRFGTFMLFMKVRKILITKLRLKSYNWLIFLKEIILPGTLIAVKDLKTVLSFNTKCMEASKKGIRKISL